MDVIKEFRKKQYKNNHLTWNKKVKSEKYAFEIRPKERSDIMEGRRDTARKEMGISTAIPTEEEVATLLENINIKANDLHEGSERLRYEIVRINILDDQKQNSSSCLEFLSYKTESDDILLSSLKLRDSIQRLEEIFLYLKHLTIQECSLIVTPVIVQKISLLVERYFFSLASSPDTLNGSREMLNVKKNVFVELECLAFRILSCIAGNPVLCQILNKLCVLVIFKSLDEPLSLRFIQMAFIAFSTLFDASSGLVKSSFDSFVESESIDKEKFVCKLIQLCQAVIKLNDLGYHNLGRTAPLDGFEGIIHSILVLGADITHESSLCALLLHKKFFNLVLKRLAGHLFSIGLENFDSEATYRMALTETLVGLMRCLSLLSEKPECLTSKTQNAIVELTQERCFILFWHIALMCFKHMESQQNQHVQPIAEGGNSEALPSFPVNSYHDPSLTQRLYFQPCDILLPCLDILHSLLLYQINSWIAFEDSNYLTSRFIEYERETADKNFFNALPYSDCPNGLLLRALLSPSMAIKRRGIKLLSALAAGSINDMEFCICYLPMIFYCLINVYPYFIHQDALLALNRLAMNCNGHLFYRILHYPYKSWTTVFEEIAQRVDPYSFREQLSLKPQHVSLTDISSQSLPFVLSVVLGLLHSDQKNIHLIHMAFDFLEYSMSVEPALKLIIYEHGGVNSIESVQCLNNDSVFFRTVRMVEKYFDEIEELN